MTNAWILVEWLLKKITDYCKFQFEKIKSRLGNWNFKLLLLNLHL